MEIERPDPDLLLKKINEQNLSNKGFLKVFLGYAAGVGKSFAMLQAAQVAISQGRSVCIGWIQRHERPETIALIEGIPEIPPRAIREGEITLSELDLDACLELSPEVLLIDELAHSNLASARHKKRWQDVQELLDRGIEVWTTINIQHLESMNDIVGRVTGVSVHETVPDSIFDKAKEVEIVDIDPEDLIDRIKAGKVYRPGQAQRALDSFFRKENLLALREITFRRAAERVGKEVDQARHEKKDSKIWPVRETLMVSVGPSPLSEDLLRQAARMARSLSARLVAVSIETPGIRIQNTSAHDRLAHNLGIAEALGAETVILQGDDVAKDLVTYARKRNVTKLVIGKNRDTGLKRLLRRTIGDELMRLSGDIDVYVLSGRKPEVHEHKQAIAKVNLNWRNWLGSVVLVGLFSALALFFESMGMGEANLVLTLLMSVVLSAALLGRSASVVSAILSVLSFNFFFTNPRYSLSVDDPQNYLVFLFLMTVGLVIGWLTHRIRKAVETSRSREQRMETLNRLQKQLAQAISNESVRDLANGFLSEILGTTARIILRTPTGRWETHEPVEPGDQALFDWCWEHRERAGQGTGTLFNHSLSVWPLLGSQGPVGILALENHSQASDFVESITALIASALERVTLFDQTRELDRLMENERTRNSILNSLSHDLRTPLSIIGAKLDTIASSSETNWSNKDRLDLELTQNEISKLVRQVENLLELSRLTDKDWGKSLYEVPIEEPLLAAVERIASLHPKFPLVTDLPEEVETGHMEPRLILQCLLNFLENAVEHASGETIGARVKIVGDRVRYEVFDDGKGIPNEEKSKIFQKYFRGNSDSRSGVTGLGLTIAAEIARVHRGEVGVIDRPGGGSIFYLEFPRWKE